MTTTTTMMMMTRATTSLATFPTALTTCRPRSTGVGRWRRKRSLRPCPLQRSPCGMEPLRVLPPDARAIHPRPTPPHRITDHRVRIHRGSLIHAHSGPNTFLRNNCTEDSAHRPVAALAKPTNAAVPHASTRRRRRLHHLSAIRRWRHQIINITFRGRAWAPLARAGGPLGVRGGDETMRPSSALTLLQSPPVSPFPAILRRPFGNTPVSCICDCTHTVPPGPPRDTNTTPPPKLCGTDPPPCSKISQTVPSWPHPWVGRRPVPQSHPTLPRVVGQVRHWRSGWRRKSALAVVVVAAAAAMLPTAANVPNGMGLLSGSDHRRTRCGFWSLMPSLWIWQ